eukprot:TRINITY_DN7723_c0_g2_i1.p2 TRINITY_DN7723_c0_g2~~TRINITY_DN7723_c0_g2_i1.p2  ORF type:complete len:382 (+),score=119.60 TRINITY_DN7723_c0_g2_i1:88-1146(+)
MAAVKNAHYSSEWEAVLWARHQGGELSLKEYMAAVDRVLCAASARLPAALYAAPTDSPVGAPPGFDVPLPVPRTDPGPPRRRIVPSAADAAPPPPAMRPEPLTSAVPSADAAAACPPSWGGAAPHRPASDARPALDELQATWDPAPTAVVNGALFSKAGTVVSKSQEGCLVVFSDTVLRGPRFRLAWRLELLEGYDTAPGVLVGVVPYGPAGQRFGMLYRASDGCLRKPARREALGYADRAPAGAEMLMEVDVHEGVTLRCDGAVVFSKRPDALAAEHYGAPDGGAYLACCVLNGAPSVRVGLRPVAMPERAAAAVRIQCAYRMSRARRRRAAVSAAYRGYLKDLHAWEWRL